MEAVLSWVRQFLIIYFILTILMHLTALEQYQKYLRFFSGIILLLVLLSPVLQLFGASGRLDALVSYETFWEQLDSARQDTEKLEFLQNSHYVKKYEDAIAQDILFQAQKRGIPVRRADASLSEDYRINSITIWLDTSKQQDLKAARENLTDFLKQTYELEASRIDIR